MGCTHFIRHRLGCSLALALFSWPSPAAAALPGTPELAWNGLEQRVSADLRDWKLPKVLEQISAATGWDIYIEPDTQHTVSVTFQNAPPGEALRLLLRPLNFALVPTGNGQAKLLVFHTTAHAATERVAAGPSAESEYAEEIPNELIVTVNEGTDIDALARQLGARVVGRADGLNAYRLQFDDEEAAQRARQALAENSDVESVDANYSVPRPTTPQPVNFAGAGPLNFTFNPGEASDLMIGLVDTAIQPLGNDLDAFFLDPIFIATAGELPLGQPTHGTAMALAILHGLDGASVPILPVDIFGAAGTTTHFEVALGVIRAVEAGANIVAMSFGGKSPSPFLEQIMNQAHGHGVLLVAAAGNEPVTTPVFPAAYPSVIAVTAGDRHGNIAQYANRGAFVEAIGPGSILIPFASQNFHMAGTSVANAYVAGHAAQLAHEQDKSPREIEAVIRQPKP